MRIAPPTELKEVAQAIYRSTEARLKAQGIALPFPADEGLPKDCQVVQAPIDSAGGAWQISCAGPRRVWVAVIASVEERGGELWYHLSLSRRDQIPTYEDMVKVKDAFMGDRWAIQCFVPKAEHVNIHPRTLHLWHCMTGPRPFPNFNIAGHI